MSHGFLDVAIVAQQETLQAWPSKNSVRDSPLELGAKQLQQLLLGRAILDLVLQLWQGRSQSGIFDDD
eukprot:CAMPEP_0206423848 /NCGR_PEP_ID=MMETSP0324_2-20121206/2899_1 /ASSEMBLY_ACC=CAM_ASM_000836 /TAXON_ID=2866 /ORGANISM="Crypthecodinium cohnii, Strain Seligo" /LENGTH=67 /DNA_ID=CAMNT_0053888435 /DNA_START=1055 /DNA_END=1255 /DNA_ORIENTATION=+